jgi:hypothetical protein
MKRKEAAIEIIKHLCDLHGLSVMYNMDVDMNRGPDMAGRSVDSNTIIRPKNKDPIIEQCIFRHIYR